MKSLRMLFVLAACSLLSLVALAQQSPPTAWTTLIDTHGQSAQVVTQRLGIVHDLFGKKGFDVDSRVFGGVAFKHGSLTGGFCIARPTPFTLAREIHFNIEPFIGQTAGSKIDGGFIVPITIDWAAGSSGLTFSPTFADKAVGLSLMYRRRF